MNIIFSFKDNIIHIFAPSYVIYALYMGGKTSGHFSNSKTFKSCTLFRLVLYNRTKLCVEMVRIVAEACTAYTPNDRNQFIRTQNETTNSTIIDCNALTHSTKTFGAII